MKEDNIDTGIVANKQVFDMFTVANEFCIFMEEHESREKTYISEYLNRVLPLLYIKGLLLPDVEPNYEIDNERFVTEDKWEYMYNSVMQIFGSENSYYFWSFELNEYIQTTVSENLADMYQDLKDFVLLYSKPLYYAKINAIYLCKESFFQRWGKIITHLLGYLHYINYEKENENDEKYATHS